MLSVFYAKCQLLSVANKPIMLSAVMLNAVMLNFVMLNFVMLNVVMLSFVMLIVVTSIIWVLGIIVTGTCDLRPVLEKFYDRNL